MRKLLMSISVLVFVFSMTACSNKENTKPNNETQEDLEIADESDSNAFEQSDVSEYKQPEGMSDTTFHLCLETIEHTDAFLAGKESNDEAFVILHDDLRNLTGIGDEGFDEVRDAMRHIMKRLGKTRASEDEKIIEYLNVIKSSLK